MLAPRPRHQITETPDIARALDLAARRWPGESRSKLLVRLVHVGTAALGRQRDDDRHRQQQAIDATSGKYGDAYPDGYLAGLRRDWPA